MTNFNVSCPEAGDGAILTFALEDMEKLHSKFGDNYLVAVLTALDKGNVTVIRNCLDIALKGGEPSSLERALTLEQLCSRIADALMLRWKGKSVEELNNSEQEPQFAEVEA